MVLGRVTPDNLMIADLSYKKTPASDDVVVELFWQRGTRMGQVKLPPCLEQSVAENGLPNLTPLPVISAVAYAMVLAAQTRRSLTLSGDDQVWPLEWGSLVRVH